MNTTYNETVASFEKITAEKAQELIKGDGEAVIYIGKAVCPYCQLFIPKLKKVADKTDTLVYYVDSVDPSDMDGITAFRKEYDIPTVPGFIYTKDSDVKVRCDSSMTEEEIENFMKD